MPSGRVPATRLRAIRHSERSAQKTPMPRVSSTRLSSTELIDISVTVIPRSVVVVTVFPVTITRAESETMPSWPPRTRHPSTMLIGWSNVNEMSMSWA